MEFLALPPPCPSDEEISSCFEQERGRGKRREGEKKKGREKKREQILLCIEMATYIERRDKEKEDKGWRGKGGIRRSEKEARGRG